MSFLQCEKISVILKLNNGTDSQGNRKYINLPINSLRSSAYVDSYDDTWENRRAYGDKVIQVVTALAPCISPTTEYVKEVITYNLSVL